MKKISYILLIFVLFSCQNEEKIDKKPIEIAKTTDSISKPKVDSTSVQDTTSQTKELENKTEENILTKSDTKSKYKVDSISELWNRYKSSKMAAEKFIAKNNLDSIIYYLNRAADASYKLSREDIATWQLNNIGYYSINVFKKLTNYDLRMQKLVTFKNLKKKALYVDETKKVFRENYHILSEAEHYLFKAQLLDNELEPSERTKIIESNLEFINWIGNYISNGKRKTITKKDE